MEIADIYDLHNLHLHTLQHNFLGISNSTYHLMTFITFITLFRVKLVFECEFKISWSLGPLDLWTFGPWDLGLRTLGLWDLFPPPTPPHTVMSDVLFEF